MPQFIKDTSILYLQDKTGCKKICFGYCNCKVNARKSFNIDDQKFINANNNFFKKLGSSHFLIIFCMHWELLNLTSTDFRFLSLLPCLFAWKRNQNGTCIFLLEITLIKQSRDLIGKDY